MQIFLLGVCLVSALSIPIAENGSIPLLALKFNPNHNHVNAASKQASLQTTSRPHHHATPKQNYSMPICEIKNQKSAIGHQILLKLFILYIYAVK
jgi:hypothetical protein